MESTKPIFIAEVKTLSPFGYTANSTFNELLQIAVTHGDWVSVHTSALWGGDPQAIALAKLHTTKPVLAKGIHATDAEIQQMFKLGADCVLSVSKPRLIPDVDISKELFETDFTTIKACVGKEPKLLQSKFVCNARDLTTGERSRNFIHEFVESGLWICQASNIVTICDVHEKAAAYIVGQHLEGFSYLPR